MHIFDVIIIYSPVKLTELYICPPLFTVAWIRMKNKTWFTSNKVRKLKFAHAPQPGNTLMDGRHESHCMLGSVASQTEAPVKISLRWCFDSVCSFSDVLCVTVIQGQNDYGVTYSSTEICAVKASTVEISCTYTYPSRINGSDTEVKETFWFNKLSGNQPVDLRTDSDYQDRVEYSCSEKSCTLRITDLRESDSAEYKFRIITNQPDGRFTGSPGVTLRVTGNIFVHILMISKCLTSEKH